MKIMPCFGKAAPKGREEADGSASKLQPLLAEAMQHLGRPAQDADPVASQLQKNWCGDAATLATLRERDLLQIGLPLVLVKELTKMGALRQDSPATPVTATSNAARAGRSQTSGSLATSTAPRPGRSGTSSSLQQQPQAGTGGLDVQGLPSPQPQGAAVILYSGAGAGTGVSGGQPEPRREPLKVQFLPWDEVLEVDSAGEDELPTPSASSSLGDSDRSEDEEEEEAKTKSGKLRWRPPAARAAAAKAAHDEVSHSSGSSSDLASGASSAEAAFKAKAKFKPYDPADYADLDVSSEVKALFEEIGRYRFHTVELETTLKPFIPEWTPTLGTIEMGLSVQPPPFTKDMQDLSLADGFTKLHEPSLNESKREVVFGALLQHSEMRNYFQHEKLFGRELCCLKIHIVRIKLLVLAASQLVDVLLDANVFITFLNRGLRAFAALSLLIVVVPRVLHWLFLRAYGQTSCTSLLVSVLQLDPIVHCYESLRADKLTHSFFWSQVTEGTIEGPMSALLTTYALLLEADEDYDWKDQKQDLLILSICSSCASVAKAVLMLDFYGRTDVSWPEWLWKFSQRILEVTFRITSAAIFGYLTRPEHVSVHRNAEMMLGLLILNEFLVMLGLVHYAQQRSSWAMKLLFAQIMVLCRPPEFLAQLRRANQAYGCIRAGELVLMVGLSILVNRGGSCESSEDGGKNSDAEATCEGPGRSSVLARLAGLWATSPAIVGLCAGSALITLAAVFCFGLHALLTALLAACRRCARDWCGCCLEGSPRTLLASTHRGRGYEPLVVPDVERAEGEAGRGHGHGQDEHEHGERGERLDYRSERSSQFTDATRAEQEQGLQALQEEAEREEERQVREAEARLESSLMERNPVLAGLLIGDGANPNGLCSSGSGTRPLLHLAVELEELGLVCVLLDHAADVQRTEASSGATALHLAARALNREVTLALLEAKARVNARDRGGLTPLACARRTRVLTNDTQPSAAEELLISRKATAKKGLRSRRRLGVDALDLGDDLGEKANRLAPVAAKEGAESG